ncbi:HER112Cp [Eremothecium sinecaudum]|uniref:HER112Cp n=1 Tax=Eremothecium sinecaudum TaxID=45286 RepID=A0A109UXI7_9SACH|nr:HER112Cp [Eremothecium sinecaudum]AMD21391.1 HER112Cp [Eremothecium sinecaudum]
MRLLLLVCFLLGMLRNGVVEAKRKLSATSMVTCMENSQLLGNTFNVVFDPDDMTLHFDLDITTEIDGNVLAEVEVWAYGFKVIKRDIEMCSLNWKQFCPLVPGNIVIKATEKVSEEYANQIPGIAYQVPDIDAYLRVGVVNMANNAPVACIQAFFSNGKTVSQTGVKWVTAMIAGSGLLVSAILSAFGNSNAASHISANSISLFLYFQSVAVVSMEQVHSVPPIAAAWSENFIWSMGLIRVSFMQKIIRWYVQATGGHPTVHLISNDMSVLAQRSLDYLTSVPVLGSLVKRAEVLYGNENTLIFRGIKRLAYRMSIENTAVVCTGIIFFLLFGYVLAGLIIGFNFGSAFAVKRGWLRHTTFKDFRLNWKTVLKGVLLRYIFLGFTQVTILCFWEWTQRDSPAVVILSTIILFATIGIMVWAAYRSISFARKSIIEHNNPAAVLYGDSNILNKYGFFYTMYNATHYWWSCVVLSYALLKAIMIAFVQVSGKVQAVFVFLFDISYLIALIYFKPYLDRGTNILNIFISSVTVANSFLFLFFSDIFGQPGSVSSIMGWVFFIVNAAFSFILLIMVLVYIVQVVFSESPDLRFRPAKDDRASFQRKSVFCGIDHSATQELHALGQAAQAHNKNWEEELQHRRKLDTDPEAHIDMQDSELKTFDDDNRFRKLSVSNIIRKLSLKRNKSTKSAMSIPAEDPALLSPYDAPISEKTSY